MGEYSFEYGDLRDSRSLRELESLGLSLVWPLCRVFWGERDFEEVFHQDSEVLCGRGPVTHDLGPGQRVCE